MDVVQAAGLESFDVKRLLSLAREARFWKVCKLIHLENNEYDLVLECYINDRSDRHDFFRFVRTTFASVNENQKSKLRRKIFELSQEIIEIDARKAFKLFCVFFKTDLHQLLKMIEHDESLKFQILKVKLIDPFFFTETKVFLAELFFVQREETS